MRNTVIIGVGMSQFGKFLETNLEDLGRVAIWRALEDSGVPPLDIGVAYVANALHGLINDKAGQIGQQVLATAGLGGMPVINVENACAGGSTALRGAWLEVASGTHDIALAVGVEKMYHPDVAKSIRAMTRNMPYDGMGYQFTAEYAMFLRRYMDRYSVTTLDFAKVVEKNSLNGSFNPYAQHRTPLSAEQVLNSRIVADPLTLYMCCSMGDGGAAAVVCTEELAAKFTDKPPVHIAACELISGRYRKGEEIGSGIVQEASAKAYEKAGIAPEDVDVVEMHDAMAPAELLLSEYLGFCAPGEGAKLLNEGRTKITGDKAINPSGGLAAKGHPVSATGLAQVSEIVWQLRGEAGERQVKDPKVGLIENAGGWTLFDDNAACAITILKR